MAEYILKLDLIHLLFHKRIYICYKYLSQYLVLNKIDTVDNLDENLSIIDKYIPRELKINQIRGISSISKQGVKELFDEIFKKLT